MPTEDRPWSEIEDSVLRLCYTRVPKKTVAQMQDALLKNAHTVRCRIEIAERVKILKVEEYREEARKRLRGAIAAKVRDNTQCLVEYQIQLVFRSHR